MSLMSLMSRVLCVVAFVSVCVALGCVAQESSPQCGGHRCAGALEAGGNNGNKNWAAQKEQRNVKTKLRMLSVLARKWSANCEEAGQHAELVSTAVSSISHCAEELQKLLREYPDSNEFQKVANRANHASEKAAGLRATVESGKNAICSFSGGLSASHDELAAAVEDMGRTTGDMSMEEIRQNAKEIATKAKVAFSSAVKEARLHRSIVAAEHAKDSVEELRAEMNDELQHAKATAQRMQRQNGVDQRNKRPVYQE